MCPLIRPLIKQTPAYRWGRLGAMPATEPRRFFNKFTDRPGVILNPARHRWRFLFPCSASCVYARSCLRNAGTSRDRTVRFAIVPLSLFMSCKLRCARIFSGVERRLSDLRRLPDGIMGTLDPGLT